MRKLLFTLSGLALVLSIAFAGRQLREELARLYGIE